MSNESPTFKSAAGGYVIFDITDPKFLPGKIPGNFCEEANANGPWFFQPAHWNAENRWESSVARLMKFPLMYSPGFATAEAALADANAWEVDTWRRVTGYVEVQACVDDMFGRPL